MLIKTGNDRANFKGSRYANAAGTKTTSENAIPLNLKSVPTPGDGRRVVSEREMLNRIENDPELRKKISMVEKIYGCETGIRRLKRKQLVHDRTSDMHYEVNKKAIELQAQKQKMIGHITGEHET